MIAEDVDSLNVSNFKARCGCVDCGELHGTYMVDDRVWLQAFPDYAKVMSERLQADGRSHTYLCFGCLERRLGRPLTIDDFTDAPCNTTVRFGFTMAQKR